MTPRERALAGVTAAVLGVGGVWFLLLEPAWTRWTEADDKARVLEAALVREREQAAGLRAVLAERDELDARLRPAEGDAETAVVPAFLAHARSLTRAAGFDPTTLRYLGARPLLEETKARAARDAKPAFAELSFELRARTSLERLTDFLVRLATSGRPVRVASLGLTPRQGSTTELDVDLGLVALAPADVLQAAKRP